MPPWPGKNVQLIEAKLREIALAWGFVEGQLPKPILFGVHGRTLILVKILKTLTAATKRMKGIHHTAEIPFQSA